MMRLLAAFAAGAIALFGQALPRGVTRGATVEGITEYTLDNGTRFLLFPDQTKPTVTVNVTVLVGSKHENYGETGMAHLLEHLVFKGTPKHPGVQRLLKDRGAQYNGSTWYDRTNYFETLTASDDNLKWAIEMEADRLVNSNIAQSDLDSEMTVVRNEFEAGENQPFRVLLQRTMAAAYEWHNYGKTTIGSRSDIENVPIERLRAFYRRYYQPDNIQVVVAGRFEPAKAIEWIAGSFGAIPKPQRKLEPVYTKEPAQDGERTVTVRRTGDLQMLMAVYHIAPGTHPDFAPLAVLSSVLGESPTGRMYKALVDNKKAASVLNWEFQLAEPGVLVLGAEVRKEQSFDDARRTLLETIDGARKEPPAAEEVARAKTRLLKQIELGLADSGRVGIDLSEWGSMGDWRMLFLHRDRIEKVTPADVQRVAAMYLKEDNRTLGSFLPTEKPDRVEMPAAPDLTAMLKDFKGREVVDVGEAFDPSPANVEARAKRFALPNGTKVVMLSKRNRGATVQGRITLRYGDEKSLAGKTIDAELAWSMLMRGTSKKSRQQLQDDFDKLKAQVGMGGSTSFGTANVQTVRASLPAAVRLMAEVLRDPAFAESEFEQVKTAALAGIEQQKSDPAYLAQNTLNRHMSPYPRGDVRAVPNAEERIADLKAATLDGARSFYRSFFGGSGSAVITLVGDFDAAEMEKVLRDSLGDWKTPRAIDRPVRSYKKVAAINQPIETPDKANAVFTAGTTIQMDDDHADYPALLIANYMFGSGSSSRLYRRFREKEGWSYGAGSQLSVPTKEDSGSFFAFAILAPQNMQKLEAGFREEISRSVTEGFSADEVAKGKTSWSQQQAVQRANDGVLLGLLSGPEYWGRRLTWQGELESKVAKLTPEQVNAAWKKYIDPAAISLVKAGDFKKAAAQ